MRDGWEAEAWKWAQFARTPGHDSSHDAINLPALRDLLPEPGNRTLELGCGQGGSAGSCGRWVTGWRGPTPRGPWCGWRPATRTPSRPCSPTRPRCPSAIRAFDLVVAFMCLHDMNRMPQAVAEAGRALERGGQLCASI